MMRHLRIVTSLVPVLLAAGAVLAAERFPPPDFTSHELPQTTTPPPASLVYEYADLAALATGLALATYLALVRRSRKGLLALTVVSLLWLGFWRGGCICPIGAIQDVSLALADPAYVIPLSVVAFFTLPILVALFFGRTFCAAVCPLGAVQELVVLKPVRVPRWLDESLGLIPYVYLGAAVLFTATGGPLVICSYDPFVTFFRLPRHATIASANMLVLGGSFLVVGLFVGRPYCRYLCPYGAILGLCSKVSKRHARITPEECIKCRLCEDACPYGAIRAPTVEQTPRERLRGRRRLAAMLLLLPLLVGVGLLLGRGLAAPLSRLHPTVRRAEYVRQAEGTAPEETPEEPTGPIKERSDVVEAFRNTGRPPRDLYAEAVELVERFRVAGGWLGTWVGLVFGVKLVHLSIRRRRADYQPDRAYCVSCGRCYWYCPHEQLRLGLIEALPVVDSADSPPKKSDGEDRSELQETRSR
jgi:polyferredoxin